MIASALATESIGIHAIFGAFLLGAIIPHDSDVASSFRHKLEDVVSILLLPAFFAITGARTQIGLVSEPLDWVFCGVIIIVATLGSLNAIGVMAVAFFFGLINVGAQNLSGALRVPIFLSNILQATMLMITLAVILLKRYRIRRA